MSRRVTVTVLLCLGMAPLAPGQEQTASIVGVVRDVSGGVIPGASVIAAGTGGLAVSAATDEAGRYRFPSLPPGRFSLTAHLVGFGPARVENVDLTLGRQLEVPITLETAALSESIRVVAESPTIALTQSARTTSFRADEIRGLPNGREFTVVVNQVSGANMELSRAGGLPLIDGSSGSENRYVIDGVETTDLLYGTPGRVVGGRMASDFLDEVQVKSSGYAAEFGGSTGGVVNIITRSGSNEWHGEALLYWEDDALDADPRPSLRIDPTDSTAAEYVTYPKDAYRALEPGFTLGGPIVRDSLWFQVGYLPRFEPVQRTAAFADGTTRTLGQDRSEHQMMANVTGQLGSSWRFRTAFSRVRSRWEGQLQNQDGTSSPDAFYDQDFVQPSWSLTASADWIPSPAWFTSLRAGYWHYDVYNENVYQGDRLVWKTSSLDLPGVPPEYQQPGGHSNVPNNFGRDREKQGRLGLQWDSTFFFSGAGRHQLKAGIQVERRTLDVQAGDTGNVHDLYWDQSFFGQRGPYGYYAVFANPLLPNRGFLETGDGRATSVGLFVQDSWTIGDRLTLNLGLRAENERVPSFSSDPAIPQTAIEFGFGDKLAPRLGFAWDATGDGRTKVYGSWGVFYDVMKLFLPLASAGRFLDLAWYTLDDPDLSGIENNPACPPECPGTLIFGPLDLLGGTPINDPDAHLLDPDLKPMRLQELVVGIEREIAPNVTLSARYIHKQLDRAVEDTGLRDADGEFAYRVANPGFGIASSFVPEGGSSSIPYPRARRDYDAVEVGVQRRQSNGWSARAFYLWSRLWGNTGGLTDSTFFSFSPNYNRTSDSVFMPFDQTAHPVHGRLSTDRPHQIKAQFVYDSLRGTTVGVSWFGASGIPRSRLAGFVPGQSFPVFYEGRETDGRAPFTTRLDLQVQHRIRLNDRVGLTLMATVFNVFNQGQPTDYVQDRLFQGQAIAISEVDFFAGFDAEELAEEQGLVPNPTAGMAWAFQFPRTIRLGARVSF